MPIRLVSIRVCAMSQSTALEASVTSLGPATSIVPPDNQKPLAVYDRTTYPASARVLACARYWKSLNAQLATKTMPGCVPGVVGSMTLDLSTAPSAAVMSFQWKPVVGAAAARAG